jgi:hypothetical protein
LAGFVAMLWPSRVVKAWRAAQGLPGFTGD